MQFASPRSGLFCAYFFYGGVRYDLSLHGRVEFDGERVRVASDRSGRYYLVSGPADGDQYRYQRELEGPHEATLEEALAHWRKELKLTTEEFVYDPRS